MNSIAILDKYLTMAMDDYKRIRTCPPQSSLLTNTLSREVAYHLTLCDFCNSVRNSGGQGVKMVATSSSRTQVSNEHDKKLCIAGQVWELNSSLGGWVNNGLHYNPPFVLVLEVSNQTVTVSQIYEDPQLRCPGDVPLGKSVPGFAEPWNIYSLKSTDLKSCWAKVSNKVVFQVSLMMKHKFGDELTEYQQKFRQLETDIGHVIAAQSQEALIKELLEERDTFYADISGGELHEHHYAESIGSRLDLVLGDGAIRIYRPVAQEWLASVRDEFQKIVDKYNECQEEETIPEFIAFTRETGGRMIGMWKAAAMDVLADFQKSLQFPSYAARGEESPELEKTKADRLQKLTDYLDKHREINWFPAKINPLAEGKRLVIGLFHRNFKDYSEEAVPQAPLPEVTVDSELKGVELAKESLNPESGRGESWFILDLFVTESGELFPEVEKIGIIIQESKENPNKLTMILKNLPSE